MESSLLLDSAAVGSPQAGIAAVRHTVEYRHRVGAVLPRVLLLMLIGPLDSQVAVGVVVHGPADRVTDLEA